MADAKPPIDKNARLQEARRIFEESIKYITGKEVSTAARSGQEKAEKLEPDVPSTLESLWQDVTLLISMLRDYATRRYRQVPFGSIAAVAAAVLYFVSPVDTIPDFIPGIGYVDDAAVLMLCLNMVRGDVEKYRIWKQADDKQRNATVTVSGKRNL